MTLPADRRHLRAGDADRNRAAERIRGAVGEGRLTLEEADERLAAAYRARTLGELADLLDDLPEPEHELPVPAH